MFWNTDVCSTVCLVESSSLCFQVLKVLDVTWPKIVLKNVQEPVQKSLFMLWIL